MKKSVLYLSQVITAAVFTVFSLTSCGEDLVTNGGENSNDEQPIVQTSFSSGDDDASRVSLKTSINNKRAFFWEIGDKIWVSDGTNYEKSAKSDIAAPKTSAAKFTLNGSYTADTYQVLYTGYANGDTATTQYNKVTVADVQTQKAWNDGSHLGTSGDCGTATAYKQANGTYRFSLEHKASYLLFYPFLNAGLAGDYTLEKIEVYSDLSASNIAGTFDFTFANGLANSPAAGTGKQEMTLNCGNLATGEFGLPKTAPNLSDVNNAAPHCLMVIAPGDHQLTIRYVTKKSDGTQYKFIKDIALKQYKPNGVYTFVHEMKDAEVDFGFEFNEKNTFYQWGRTYESYGTETYDYDTLSTSFTEGPWSKIPTTRDFYRNYFQENIYYDNSITWKYNRRDGASESRRGGWWLKKKAYCTYSGEDSYSKKTYNGRPEQNVMNMYFFIPKLENTRTDIDVCYWLNSPDHDSQSLSYAVLFTPAYIYCPIYRKWRHLIAGTRPDGTPWFQ